METIVYGFLFVWALARLTGWVVLLPFRVAGRLIALAGRRSARTLGTA